MITNTLHIHLVTLKQTELLTKRIQSGSDVPESSATKGDQRGRRSNLTGDWLRCGDPQWTHSEGQEEGSCEIHGRGGCEGIGATRDETDSQQ